VWELLEDFDQLHYVRVGGESSQCLHFPEVVDFFQTVEVTFHAFDGHELASFDALGFEDFAEGAFADLGEQAVL